MHTPRITAALDFTTSPSSWSGGRSNTAGGVMTCGVPCLATHLVDQAWLKCDIGKALPSCDATTLLHSWREILDAPEVTHLAVREAAKLHIVKYFSVRKGMQ